MISFLESLGEHVLGYEVSERDLLLPLPVLLKRQLLQLYRLLEECWTDWQQFIKDFRKLYLPPDFTERLEREIFLRNQRDTEPALCTVLS